MGFYVVGGEENAWNFTWSGRRKAHEPHGVGENKDAWSLTVLGKRRTHGASQCRKKKTHKILRCRGAEGHTVWRVFAEVRVPKEYICPRVANVKNAADHNNLPRLARSCQLQGVKKDQDRSVFKHT